MKIKNLKPTTKKSTANSYKLKAIRGFTLLNPAKRGFRRRRNYLTGFTLVEMLVSIAVFMMVITVATGSLLSIIDANNKAQSLKSVIDNLNFAIESMAKNIRVGTDYGCSQCVNGDPFINFIYKSKYVTYRFNSADHSIERCIGSASYCTAADTFTRLTANGVTINNLKFYTVAGETASGSPARVLITLSGEAGAKEKLKTKFNLQTTVSQRLF